MKIHKSLQDGEFSCLCRRLPTHFKINFFKNSFMEAVRMSNSLDPDQDPHSVQTVCKGNKQTSEVVASKERFNP